MKKFARIDNFLKRHTRTFQHQRINLCPEKRHALILGHRNVGKTKMTINIRDGKMWNLMTLKLLGNNKYLYRYKNWKARAQGEEREDCW